MDVDKVVEITSLIVFILFVGAAGFVIHSNINTNLDLRYRQGQIDALTGKVEYELRVNPDSTETWHKI